MNKLREKRLNQPPQTSEEFWEQFRKVQQEASRMYEMQKPKDSETGRVRED